MKLAAARIRDYKCIEDSERFTLGPITCLVGKNESGKTAILEALHKLKPDVAAEFSDLDYPRRKWQPRMGAERLPKNVLETEWVLEVDDRKALVAALGLDPLEDDSVVITRSYENKSNWTLNVKEDALVAHILGGAPACRLQNPTRSATRRQYKTSLLVSTGPRSGRRNSRSF